MLNVGWAWLLAFCFSTPIWALLVYFWGMPKDLIDIIKFAGIAGVITSIMAIIFIFMLKMQARKP